MRIHFWLPDSQGVGYYRGLLPATALANQGHQVMANEQLHASAHSGAFDVIVGMRVCNEGATHTWKKLARAGQSKLVFELDDDLWHIDASNKQAADFYTDERLARLTDNVRIADVVTVSTEPLADVVSQWNDNVHVVPNQIPAWLLEHERPSVEGRTVIGWRGGASHGRDFGELARPLRRFLMAPANRGRVEFHCMGQDYTDRVRSNHGLTRHTDWNPVTADFLRAVDFDCAVIPLRPSEFNESKSELALLETAALGIPAIVSAVGPYARVASQVPSIRLAYNAKDWEYQLADFMAEDEESRAMQSKVLREWAAKRTVEGNVWRWGDAYGTSDVHAAAA
jgi:hypothetical protein